MAVAFDFVDSFCYPLMASERQRLHDALDKEIDSKEEGMMTVRNELEVFDNRETISRAQQGVEKGLLLGEMALDFILANYSILEKLSKGSGAGEAIEDMVNALSADFEDGVGFHNAAEMSVQRFNLEVDFHVTFRIPPTVDQLHLLHMSLDIALDNLIAEKMVEVAKAAHERLNSLEPPLNNQELKYETVLAVQKALMLREVAHDLVHASYKVLLTCESMKLRKARGFSESVGDKLRKEKAKKFTNLRKFNEKSLKKFKDRSLKQFNKILDGDKQKEEAKKQMKEG